MVKFFLITFLLIINRSLAAQNEKRTLCSASYFDTLLNKQVFYFADEGGYCESGTAKRPICDVPILIDKLNREDMIQTYVKFVFVIDTNGQLNGFRKLDKSDFSAFERVYILGLKQLKWIPAKCQGQFIPIRIYWASHVRIE